MEQSGEYRIAADVVDVWRGLNDPEMLARCIDGCQSMEKISDNEFSASVKAKVGPVRATFQVEFELSDVVAPLSYTIIGNVKGGVAGFAKGSAQVSLSEVDSATLLAYVVKANVGGKLAQVGSRLIDAVARKMADDFFASFGENVSGEPPVATPVATPVAKRDDATVQQQESSGQWKIWVVVFAALILAMALAI